MLQIIRNVMLCLLGAHERGIQILLMNANDTIEPVKVKQVTCSQLRPPMLALKSEQCRVLREAVQCAPLTEKAVYDVPGVKER